MDDKYVIVAVESEGQIFLGYAPDECRIYYGDKVKLDNGAIGIVMVKENYESMEDLKKREWLHGEKLHRVIRAYSEKEVSWGGDKNGETV